MEQDEVSTTAHALRHPVTVITRTHAALMSDFTLCTMCLCSILTMIF